MRWPWTKKGTPTSTNPAGGGIPLTLGVTEAGHDLVIDLADATHWAIQGMTRSGKSVLTYVLLAQLAARDDVVVAGLDPTGVLLGPWEGKPRSELRHLGTSDMSQAGEVLTQALGEMEARISRLLTSYKDKISSFSAAEPLLVVVLEEYPGLLKAADMDDKANARKPADRVRPKIEAAVSRLIAEGAKVGVRVLTLAQRMDASIIGGAERSNVGGRITLRVDNADAVRMLHPNAPPEVIEAAAYFGPGHGVIETPGRPLARFRADYLDYAEYVRRVTGRD